MAAVIPDDILEEASDEIASEIDEDEEDAATMAELIRNANSLRSSVIPSKSAERYMKEYEAFTTWLHSKFNRMPVVSEHLVVSYYQYAQKWYSASSLFSKMAMLKSVLYAKHQFPLNAACWQELTKQSKKVTQPFPALAPDLLISRTRLWFLRTGQEDSTNEESTDIHRVATTKLRTNSTKCDDN